MSDHLVVVSALLVIGYLLLAVEVFLIPGFGLTGISGLGCLAAGCTLAFMWFGGGHGTALVIAVLGGATALLFIVPRTRVGRRVVHSTSLAEAHAGSVSVAIGQEGVADSDLRPAGIARFGDLRESVVTEGEYLLRGASVRVLEVRGTRIVVEAAQRPDHASPDETRGD
jgi:membrane-bound serine protease (ClpP class)